VNEINAFDMLYGYVYFKQIKDAKNPRGYSQRSLVILSPLPLVDFYKNIVDCLGRIFFENPDQHIAAEFLEVLSLSFVKRIVLL
jgi:hypothetical protein